MDTQDQGPTLIPREQYYKKMKTTTWQGIVVCFIYTRTGISEMQYCWYVRASFEKASTLGKKLYSCTDIQCIQYKVHNVTLSDNNWGSYVQIPDLQVKTSLPLPHLQKSLLNMAN